VYTIIRFKTSDKEVERQKLADMTSGAANNLFGWEGNRGPGGK